MGQIKPKIIITPVHLGMLLLSVTVMILTARLTIASDLDSLNAAAEQGDAEAQFNLGNMYFEGLGVPQNDAEAARLYRMAAEQGIAEAQFNLGIMYFTGRGVPQNDAEAAMVSAADCNLGVMYFAGVPQNDAEAARLYRMAADADTVQSGLHVFHWSWRSQGLRAGLCLVEHCRGARLRTGKGALGKHHKRNADC